MIERARNLILMYGWNSTAYQLLNPGLQLWFSAAGDAVVGYVVRDRVRVVAGAPVCAHERLAAVADEFEREARRAGEGVCYFAAGERLVRINAPKPDRTMVVLGAQPVWRPESFLHTLHTHASLRAQLHRARNKGIVVREWSTQQARQSGELHRCLKEWLATRGLPTMHFLIEPDTLDRLFDRRVFVAERAGVAVAFAVSTPIPARDGALVEQIVRGTRAPNGTAELLLDAIATTLVYDRKQQITLGLSPLSNHVPTTRDDATPWLRILLAWLRVHGRRFYNFGGLDAFKSKFQPDAWEPIHAVSCEPVMSTRTLRAIAGAFGGSTAAQFALRIATHAVSREFGRLKGES